MRIPLTPSNPATLGAVTASAAANSEGSPSPFGGLQPGAVIQARVVALTDSSEVQLAMGNALIEATTQVPLTLGGTVQLVVQNTENGVTLQLIGAIAASDTSVAKSLPAGIGVAAAAVGSANSQPVAGNAPMAVAPSATGAVTAIATNGIAPVPVQNAGAVAASQPAAAAPVDTAVAVTEAVRSAAVTQNGLAPLFAEIAAAVDLTTLPEPVQRAALSVLSLRPQLDENLDAASIKQAFANSGLFLEARLAGDGSEGDASAGDGENDAIPANSAADSAAPAPADLMAQLPVTDLKAALTVLRDVVTMLLTPEEAAPALSDAEVSATAATAVGIAAPSADGQRPVPGPDLAPVPETAAPSPAPLSAPVAPLPPFRGGPTSAQPPTAPTIDAATPPQQAARILMAATDAALSRQTLLQVASLPAAPSGASGMRAEDGGPRWNFEVPFATPQGTNVAQFEISRDGRSAVPADGVAPVWRARFSIDIDPIGPVHAQVSLRGTRTAVTLWAERAEGAARLRAGAASLADALRAAELDSGELVVRDGAPRLRGGAAAPAGHFLDRAS